jgi:hypothetical protein
MKKKQKKASAHWESGGASGQADMGRWEQPAGAQRATFYPFARWDGVKHKYAITVDIENLTEDVSKPDAKINIVVDKEIVKTITIQEMIQGYFNR